MVDIKDDEKLINHPLEQVFDIEENTTIVPHKTVSTDIVVHEKYDEKDSELDSQFQDVYDAAFEAYENQAEETELIEPKYKARNAEVAVQYLNTALNAATAKSNLKQHSDKIAIAASKGSAKTINNNLFTDRNELLRALRKRDSETSDDKPIDADFTETTETDEE